jgi:type I restriction enzyme S subunit
MSEWKKYKLEEVSANFAMGPFGSNIKAENFKKSGVPVIRGSNLNFFRYVGGDFVFLSEEKADQLRSSNCFPRDLVFTHRGTIGQVGIVPEGKYQRYVVSQSGMKLSVKKNYLDHQFLFYFFKSRIGQHELLQNESQVGVPSISSPLTSLKNVTILLPPLPEQRAIASVLSSLDDKIDLLHRQNKTLEAMAETLFRQWFVGGADEGWEEKPLSFYGTIICGKTPSKKVQNYFNGDIPFIKIPDMHGNIFIFDTSDSLTEAGKQSQTNKTLPPKSICVSCIATVGLVSLNAKESQTNQQINSIVPDEEYYRYYLYLTMRLSYDLLHSMASGGTATLNLNTGDFSKIPVLYPDQSVLETFHREIEPLFDKIFYNQSQIRTLEKLRDTLLPKLMSGEVKVQLDQSEAAI